MGSLYLMNLIIFMGLLGCRSPSDADAPRSCSFDQMGVKPFIIIIIIIL